MGKKKSPIDSMIIDLIIEHFNILAFKGKLEVLSGDEFMEIVELAEKLYFEKKLTSTIVAMA